LKKTVQLKNKHLEIWDWDWKTITDGEGFLVISLSKNIERKLKRAN
jgi:hypothetical protein